MSYGKSILSLYWLYSKIDQHQSYIFCQFSACENWIITSICSRRENGCQGSLLTSLERAKKIVLTEEWKSCIHRVAMHSRDVSWGESMDIALNCGPHGTAMLQALYRALTRPTFKTATCPVFKTATCPVCMSELNTCQ